MAFPQFRLLTFLLIIGYFVLVVRELVKNNRELSWFRKSVHLLPYIIVLIFYGVSILRGDYYPLLLKELLKGLLFLFLFLGMYQFIENRKDFNVFKRSFFWQFAVMSALVVIFSLLTYFFSSEVAFFKTFGVHHYNSLAISLTSDYNFYALYVILGFISILLVSKEYSGKHKIAGFLLALLLLLFTFTLFMSFSRRAMVVLLLLIVSLVIYFVYQQYERKTYSSFLLQIVKNYLIIFSAGVIFIFFVFYGVPDHLKQQMSYNIKPSFTKEFTNLVNRYRSIFNPDEDFETTYNLIWDQDSAIAKNSVRAGLRNKLEDGFKEDEKKTKKADNIIHSFNSAYRDYFLNTNKNAVEGQGSLAYSRIERWSYALKMYGDYSVFHKFLGNGFQYLKEYKQKFARKGAAYDYPHSPVLSALLYSGMIGLGFYVFFLVKVIRYYMKYHSELFGFAVFFIITVMFSFISGNSHFSVPALIFVTIIPLFYKSVVINKA